MTRDGRWGEARIVTNGVIKVRCAVMKTNKTDCFYYQDVFIACAFVIRVSNYSLSGFVI